MHKFIIGLLLLSSAFVVAQTDGIDLNDYPGLYSHGDVPADFRTTSTKKYQKDLEDIDAELKRKDQKTQAEFYLQSNFLFDQLLKGGKVTFGDPITLYLEDMLDKVLASDPKLRKELRIYTLKSNIANAFTTNSGIILVTTGLIAELQNEAQLAFILAHEVIHYKEKHAINNYEENTRMESGRGLYKNLSREDVELSQYQYSRELETESDVDGLKYYLTSGYDPYQAVTAMDVLLYSYLPFDEQEFDASVFESEYYRFPDEYDMDEEEINPIAAYEDYDDSKSTHPNIKSRKEAIEVKLDMNGNEGVLYQVADSATFSKYQNICRFEGVKQNIEQLAYEAAAYDIFLLMQEQPNNHYLQKSMFQCLYSLSMYTASDAKPEGTVSYKNIEGASQSLYHLLQEMEPSELNILALRYGNSYFTRFPEDVEAGKMLDQLMYEFKFTFDQDIANFRTKEAAQKWKIANSDTSAVDDSDENKKGGKYDNIKKSKEKTAQNNYYLNAFTDFADDENWKLRYSELTEREVDSTSDDDELVDEFSLGQKEIIIVQPVYLQFDARSEQPIKFESSEKSLLQLRDKVTSSAKALGLKVHYIDNSIGSGEDAQDLNELAILNDWFSEKLSHDDSEVDMIASGDEAVRAIAEKYNCSHVMWLGVASVREAEEDAAGKLLLGIFYWPYLPFVLADILRPNFYTQFFTLVANTETGEFDMGYYNAIDMRDLPSVQNSNIYYILQQVRK
jgi:hypothetical protein